MQWYVRGPGRALQKILYANEGIHRPINVHIVTDCEIIANQGNRIMNRDTNAALWAAMDSFARLNYQICYTWIPRESLASNKLCDGLSKDMRHLITSIEQRLESTTLPDAYDDTYGKNKPQSEECLTVR